MDVTLYSATDISRCLFLFNIAFVMYALRVFKRPYLSPTTRSSVCIQCRYTVKRRRYGETLLVMLALSRGGKNRPHALFARCHVADSRRAADR